MHLDTIAVEQPTPYPMILPSGATGRTDKRMTSWLNSMGSRGVTIRTRPGQRGSRTAFTAEAAEHAKKGGATARLLRDLGADLEVVAEAGDRWRIEGRGCPLSAVVRDQSRVCILIENLIARASGGVVTQRCVHGERPRCSFVVEALRDSSG